MNPSKALRPFLYIMMLLVAVACGEKKDKKKADVKPSFEGIKGIKYTEIKRWLENGLTFDKSGYQLEPQWLLSFPYKDSARIFSPERKVFYNFPVTFDHDSIVNMARTWLRVKKVTRDSLVFQILKVQNTTIYLNGPKVYMTFYADDYIKNKLKTDAQTLIRPSKADTALIRQLSNYVNTHPDTAFAARQPVQFTSRSANVTVQKVEPKVEAIRYNNIEPEDSYMYPEYNVTIKKAYKDFHYSFTALVDVQGNIKFLQPLVYIDPDFRESQIRVMKGIIDGYLKLYLNVKPGSTLGMPHTSKITLNVQGIQ